MTGNVSEWCWDWDGSISDSTEADGATSGNYRVERGGYWVSDADYALVSTRGCSYPFDRYYTSGGFRVVRQAN